MRIYIAGSSAEMHRARRVASTLIAAGHAVTSTWCDVVDANGAANPRDASVAQRLAWSVDDLNQVADSDLLLFLVPPQPASTRGAWVELGYAFAIGIRLLCVGDTGQSIFTALGPEVVDDGEIIAEISRRWPYRARVVVEPVEPEDDEWVDRGGMGGEG